MELTVFPPFAVTVAAADALARTGQVRVALGPGTMSVGASPARQGDSVYSCPGATIAVSAAALPLLELLDHDGVSFLARARRPAQMSA